MRRPARRPDPVRRRLVLLAALLAAASEAAPLEAPRGQSGVRDGQLLAQPRLTLPATAPWTTPAGRWSAGVSFLWANSFSWTQDVPGEATEDRRFLIDGEALVADVTVRRGLGRGGDVGLRLPLLWRGGGTLDAFIDAWHRLFNAPDGNRPDFVRDAFRVQGRTLDGATFAWDEQTGSGLGNLEADARWLLVGGGRGGPSVALVGRLAFPTGTGPFDGNGFGAGAQLVAGVPLGDDWDAYTGFGATAQDDPRAGWAAVGHRSASERVADPAAEEVVPG